MMIKINSLIIALIACLFFAASLNAVPKSQEALFKEYKSKKVLLKEELTKLKWKSWKNLMAQWLVFGIEVFTIDIAAPSIADKTHKIRSSITLAALFFGIKCWFDVERDLIEKESILAQEIKKMEEELKQIA